MKFCLLICLGYAMLVGCTSSRNEQPAEASPQNVVAETKMGMQKVYIDEMPRLFTTARGRKLMIPITGNLPNPAYRLDSLQVEIKGRVVTITPLAHYNDSATVIQVLVPYSKTIEIGPLETGEYQLRFEGRSGAQDGKIIVED
ncbi:hypothetical protein KJ068_13325 [bacterium]|nr:hypothetical protein [bacterium]